MSSFNSARDARSFYEGVRDKRLLELALHTLAETTAADIESLRVHGVSVASMDESLQSTESRIAEIQSERTKASGMLNSLPASNAAALHLFYIARMQSWKEVGASLGYTEDYCRELARRGLKMLADAGSM